jgi:electron transfer flavoprotein alpha subunit
MKIAVIAEFEKDDLKPATFNVVFAATQLGSDITLIVLGNSESADALAKQGAAIDGVTSVLVLEAPQLIHPLAESITEALLTVANRFDYLLAPATTLGKNFLPRLCAKLDVQPITDVIEIVSANTFVRPIYAGNVLVTVETFEERKILSIRPTAFPKQATGIGHPAIEKIVLNLSPARSEYVSATLTESSRPELSAAQIVVSGGRGLQNKENFALIERLADKLGAAVGASRAAVDAGFVPNDYQVGQTGKVVAPQLYIAIGISGAIQHLAGMKDSQVIVAINKDEEAPIFQVADYGLIGDLFQIVPELTEKLL